jgi:hypothetical protein
LIRAASTAALASALSVAVFAAYLGTLAPGVLGGDAGELQFVSPILSLTHPTGYPFLVLVNNLWSQVVPIGSVAWRLSLLNAIFASLAIGSLVLIGRLVTGSALAGAVGALFLAFSPIYWSQATGTDKYTLNALFQAAVILAAIWWARTRDERSLMLLAFLYGLSLTNHRAMLLTAPALLVFVLLHGWRPRSAPKVLLLGLLMLAPLMLYLYVPWAGSRGLPPGTWPVGTPADVLEFFLDRGYTSQIQIDGGTSARLLEFWRVSVMQLGPLGLILGLIGAVWMLIRQRAIFVLVSLILAPNLLAAANYLLPSNYAIPRFWVFFIPVYLCWAIFIGVGLQRMLSLTQLIQLRTPLRFALIGVASLALLAGGALVWGPAGVAQARAHRSAETLDGYRQDLQRGALADRFARLSLQEVAPEAIIVADWEQSTPLWYMQYVEGIRRDVLIRYPMERLEQTLNDAALAQRSVYITRALPGVERLAVTSSVGPLIQIRGSSLDSLTNVGQLVDASLGDSAKLLGATYLSGDLRVGGVLPMVLYWQALDVPREDASVSVRLVNQAGEDVAQSDVPHPVLGTSPMHAWPTGALVGDYHELAISNRLAPGEYRVEALLYRGPAAAPLPVTGADANSRGDRVRLPTATVR